MKYKKITGVLLSALLSTSISTFKQTEETIIDVENVNVCEEETIEVEEVAEETLEEVIEEVIESNVDVLEETTEVLEEETTETVDVLEEAIEEENEETKEYVVEVWTIARVEHVYVSTLSGVGEYYTIYGIDEYGNYECIADDYPPYYVEANKWMLECGSKVFHIYEVGEEWCTGELYPVQ